LANHNTIRQFAAKHILDGDVRVQENQASVSGVSGGFGGGSGNLRLELRGKNDEQLTNTSYAVMDMMKNNISGVRDVSSSYEEGMPEYRLVVDREKLKHYGTSINDLTNTFSNAISGKKAGVLANDIKTTIMIQISMFV